MQSMQAAHGASGSSVRHERPVRQSQLLQRSPMCNTAVCMSRREPFYDAQAAAAGLGPDAFVTLQHGGLISTAGGRDSRRAPLLPVTSAAA